MIDINNIYRKGMSAEQLADKVIEFLYKDKEPSFPINPFEMINQ